LGLQDGWKATDKVRDGKSQEALCVTVKWWSGLLDVDGEDIIRNCYEGHIIHLKVQFCRLTRARNIKITIGIYLAESVSQ
jgi:hypothetical protein